MTFTKHKKKMAIAGTVLALSMLFTGCTNNEPATEKPSSSSASDNGGEISDKARITNAVNIYYNSLISTSNEAYANSEKVEKTIRDVTGDPSYEAFAVTNNPFSSFDELSDEKAKELADELQKLNPSAHLFDYSQMEDRDRAVLNLLNIASSVMLTPIADQTVQIVIPEEAVVVKGNKSTIPYTSMKLSVDGEEQQMSDMLGSKTIDLILVNGEWKIDGKATYESIYANASASSASDGGE